MTIEGVNVLTSLNQDMESDITTSKDSRKYTVSLKTNQTINDKINTNIIILSKIKLTQDDEVTDEMSHMMSKKRRGVVEWLLKDARLNQHINSVTNSGIKDTLETFFGQLKKVK